MSRKSKTIAAWLALLTGVFGLHRFYLHGLNDRWGWLHPLLTLPGVVGINRMNELGQDDRLAWLLIPLLGLSVVAALLSGIVYGLTPDERWDQRHNGGQAGPASGWAAVIAVVACLLIGGTVLMATIAFSAQRYFESQASSEQG